MEFETEKFDFNNRQGHLISGRLERPRERTHSFAIFAHCFTCSKDVFAASRISRALTSHGISVLRFDFTGLGNSAGDFSNSNFSTNQEDLICAYEALARHETAPQLLIGHSLGGAAVLAAAAAMPEVKAVVTIGAPSDVPHVEKLLGENLRKVEELGEATVSLAGREFIIKKQFLEDVRSIDLAHKIENLGKALLILHSPQDTIVSIEHAARIYLAAKHPKSFVALTGADHLLSKASDSQYGADHLLSKASDSQYVADMIEVWSRPYLFLS
jgi:fermentation-respiration switch protein FrsA (DUF1100 family)